MRNKEHRSEIGALPLTERLRSFRMTRAVQGSRGTGIHLRDTCKFSAGVSHSRCGSSRAVCRRWMRSGRAPPIGGEGISSGIRSVDSALVVATTFRPMTMGSHPSVVARESKWSGRSSPLQLVAAPRGRVQCVVPRPLPDRSHRSTGNRGVCGLVAAAPHPGVSKRRRSSRKEW